jgi:murein DD-endopeptidase MepM/ murein hydrolase activator NlpD
VARHLVGLVTLIATVAAVPAAQSPRGLAVHLVPDGDLYLAHENRAFGLATVQVQNIAITNPSATAVHLEQVQIDVLAGDRVTLTESHPSAALEARWRRLKTYLDAPGVRLAEEARYRCQAVLGDTLRLSASATLEPRSAIYLSHRFYTLDPVGADVVAGRPRPVWPDTLRVQVRARAAGGRVVEAEARARIVTYLPRNELAFPLKGRWYVAASSSLRSHHRALPVHEFALDLVQIGDGGRSHAADAATHADYLAFGQPVHAMAPGVVVATRNDVPETRVKRAGESMADYRRLVLDLLAASADAYATSGGNYVVVEHTGGEFSTYAHVRAGSIRVAKGDRVTRGQMLAEVGLSGDGYEPHLHVQLTDGPDPNLARGLPLVFRDIRPVQFSSTVDADGARQLQAGEFVKTVE